MTREHCGKALHVDVKVLFLFGNPQLRLREVIVQRERAANHRGGSRQDDDPADRSDSADDLAREGFRDDISVPERRHGNNAPPEGVGKVVEFHPVSPVHFCIKNQTGEDNNWDEEDEKQNAQLVSARGQRVAQNLEIVQQFEETEDPYDSQRVQVLDDGLPAEDEQQVERDYDQEVHPVLKLPGKVQFVWAEDQA